MAISVTSWVWDHSKSRHGARLVMLALADSTRNEGGWTWPSVKELCRKTQLAERAVRAAIAEMSALGELDVQLNNGPGGCNRYRVVCTGTTPAKNAGVQSSQGADSAPLQDLHPSESGQVNGRTPAESAPPADSAPLQTLQDPPADSAPGTVNEPEVKISPSERSTPAEIDGDALFAANSNRTAPKPRAKRGRPAGANAADPQFAEWYAAYPVHKARGDAEAAYAKAIREGADHQVLLAGAKRYRDDPQVHRGFGKHPATWLNKKCWLDEDIPAPQAQQDRPPVGRPTDYSDEEYHSGW